MSTAKQESPTYAIVDGKQPAKKPLPEGAEVYYTENPDGTLTCNHCGYTFKPRVDYPKRCSRCQKDLWNWRALGVPSNGE